MVYGRSIAIGVLFLAIVSALSALIFYLSLGPCPSGTFACDNGTLCVPQRQICDHRPDCIDGSDEHPVECGMLYGSKQMTGKIVLNAIEKRRQKLQKHQQQQQQHSVSLNVGDNVTMAATTTTATTKNQSSDLLVTISTYPKKCICRLLTVLYCSANASLTRIPNISDEVTTLIIVNNNITLHTSAFVANTNLQTLKLKYNNIQTLPVGTFENLTNLERLDIRYNRISSIPEGVFRGLTSLQWLFLSSNQLKILPIRELSTDLPSLEWLALSDNQLTLEGEEFPRMPVLYELFLDFNRIAYIGEGTFTQLDNLHLLDLNGNIITHIHPKAFWGLRNIRDIRLIGNPLLYLSPETFLQNNYLDALSLAFTPLKVDDSFLQTLNVSYLNLNGIKFEMIEFEAIQNMLNLKYIIYDRFYFCSMTPNVKHCKPNTDGVSSFKDLLSKPVLRYSAWIMAVITITGNIMVLWGRFIYRDENKAVTMVIRNLALADILMGFYLLIIGMQDQRYRDVYYSVALDWITSWHCAAVGALAVSSSEVSMLILAFMSLERFLLIADPFRGHHHISVKNIFFALLSIWVMGVGIAVAPVILWHSSTKFYGTYSGTCFPLHIQEPYPLGWQYSAFMFLGVNLFLLIMIAFLYTALLVSIWRTRKATPLSLLDCEFAVRFFFIVLTDALCWAPIIMVKIWVFFNYNISDDIYAWLVVFILPLNSAVNPLLYTFTTPKYRNQVLMRGWKKITARKRHHQDPSNGITIATGTGSSQQQEESSGKAMPLVCSKGGT
ncbi:leucine-rich repeat-containing G protein-coupled receptor 3 [Musca autumnalis]|uniref:leucine-rich repeat-containing G protein-coupled receptor 3 n=1 Tax=Musca autumnalis TaxID=221902 RepID=UPI003CEE5849